MILSTVLIDCVYDIDDHVLSVASSSFTHLTARSISEDHMCLLASNYGNMTKERDIYVLIMNTVHMPLKQSLVVNDVQRNLYLGL